MNEKSTGETAEKQLEKYDENQGVAISCEPVEETLSSCME